MPDTSQPEIATACERNELSGAAEHGLPFCRAVQHTSPAGDVVAMLRLSTPTVNSRERSRAGTLAPWLIDSGLNNRSARLRAEPPLTLSTRSSPTSPTWSSTSAPNL